MTLVPNFKNFKILAAFLAGFGVAAAVIGALAVAALPEPEVRVQARRLDDGRVEVAVQHRVGPEQQWGERTRPERRFVPADAEVGRWLSSSAAAAQTGLEPELYCLVTHEHPGDESFGNVIRQAASQQRWASGQNVNVQVHGSPDAAEQSELVRQCVADGAAAVGVTLANPDGVEAAIRDALDAGVIVTTFNSGVRDFKRVGSLRHVGLDELEAGREAAEQFVAAGVTGAALCVIHEERNVGLEERCEGFEAAYPGTVERLRVHASGVGDVAATVAAIEARLRADDGAGFAAVLTLNDRISGAALQAIKATGSQAALATFDHNIETLQSILDGEIIFAIDSAVFVQAWLTLSSMRHFAVSRPRLAGIDFGIEDPAEIDSVIGVLPILLHPRIRTAENASSMLRVRQVLRERFSQQSDDR